MKIAKLVGLVILSMLFGSVAMAQESYRMAMSWSFEASHLGYLVAQEQELFKKNGVDVKVERGFGASDTLRRMITGEVQFGVVDALVLIKAKAEDPNLDLVMVTNVLQQSPYNAIYIKNRKIKDIADVQKSKFGDTGGSVAQLFPAFLSSALKKPINELSYERVVLDPAIRIPALFRGDVDVVASVIFEYPNLEGKAKEAGLEIGRLDYGTYGFNPYTYGIVVRREFATKHPDQVRAVVKASLEGWAAACSNPAGASKMLVGFHKDVAPETVPAEVALALPTVQSSDTDAYGLGYLNKDRWAKTYQDAVVGWKLAPNAVPNPDVLWTSEYMPKQPVKATCKGAS